MFTSLTFGDIFKYYENDYVFLVGADEGIIYAAKILDKNDSKKLETHCHKACGGPKSYKTEHNILYYFVKLTTDGLEDRIAHLGKTATEDTRITEREINIELNQKDKEKIKEEIINSGSVLPKQLKDLVSELDI